MERPNISPGAAVMRAIAYTQERALRAKNPNRNAGGRITKALQTVEFCAYNIRLGHGPGARDDYLEACQKAEERGASELERQQATARGYNEADRVKAKARELRRELDA